MKIRCNLVCDTTFKSMQPKFTQMAYICQNVELEIMYKSFVRPSMEYANVVWGGSYDSDILKLESIQIDAIGLITGATARSNIVNLYQEVNLPTIRTRIDNASLIMMYKVLNGLAPSYLNDLVEKEEQERPYNLRLRNPLKVPFCRLETFKGSFIPRTVKHWNNLPFVIKSAASLNEFKSKYKPELTDTILLFYYAS